MKEISRIIRKLYNSYTKMPMKLRFLLVLTFFVLLFVFSVSINQNVVNEENQNNESNNIKNGRENGEGRPNEVDNSTPITKEVTVVIDPGHGGEDLGATKGDLYEKKLNLDISLKMGKLLEDLGVNVVYTRDKDIDVGLDERVNIANRINAALFISVHNNYMPKDAGYKGTETLYCTPVDTDENKMDGQKLAAIVQNKLVNTLKTVDNGTIYRPNLVVLRKTNMPAVIAEIAYMSNSSDRAKLTDEGFRQKAAEALTEAVMEAFKFMKVEKDESGEWMFMD